MQADGYPAHREADVVLADGATVHIRPIWPTDADAIVALHSRFSQRTRYLRYFSPYPRIPPRDLRRFVEVDHHDREALVAELADQLIAVGRYDRIDSHTAEVAFVVEDAHQGRGIGSVLLEHLAAAAAEEGITRFVAEVLPENGRMLRVFTDAGYHVARSYADGVVHLRIDVARTSRAIEVAREREQRTEARSVARLLTPRSVALIGASTRPGTIGHTLLRNLRAAGFTGPIYPVHPTARTVAGLPAFPSVRAISAPVDLAVIAVPAAAVPQVVVDCAAVGVHGLVIISSGFGETGPDGLRVEREVVRIAHRHGMRVVGPNCLGIANTDPAVRLNATLAPQLPDRGRVGFFSQSGALGVALLAEAHARGLGLSSFVSAGNRADVSGNDLLQYWQSDPATDVVLLYLETFGNPRKFARLARRLARDKPVVAVASSSRPPGLAGAGPGPDERGRAALFAQSGVIRVDTVSELFDVGLVLAYQPLPAGGRVGIVGNSTALGVLAAEACRSEGLTVAEGYPVDVGSNASVRAFSTTLRAAVADPNVDALVAVFVPPLAVSAAGYAEALVERTAGGDKPVVATFVAADLVPPGAVRSGADGETAAEEVRSGRSDKAGGALARLRRLGPDGHPTVGTVPAYRSVEEAVRALARVVRYAQWRRESAGTIPELPNVDRKAARRLLAGVSGERATPDGAGNAGEPDGQEVGQLRAEALLATYGITVLPERIVTSAEEAATAAAEFGGPVVVKVARRPLRHRLDLGAVRLDLPTPRAAARAYTEIVARFGVAVPAIVQPMAPPGVACVVDVIDDPSFGPIVGFGLAGMATELLGDRAWRAAPLTDTDAAALIRAPRAAPLLFGYRGAEPVDTTALEDLLLRVGLLADEQPQVGRISLNPVHVSSEGVHVIHAAVSLNTGRSVRPDRGPRRL